MHTRSCRHLPCAHQRGSRSYPHPGCLSGASSHRPGVRGYNCARSSAHARQAFRNKAQWQCYFSRHQRDVQGDALSFLDRRASRSADGSCRDRRNERPPDHGSRASHIPGARRSISSGEHRIRERPRYLAQLSGIGRDLECLAGTTTSARPSGGACSSNVSEEFKALIAKAATGATLTREEAARGFNTMISGEATPSQMGGLLMALRVRGETVDEITGAVTAMRDKMLRVRAPADAIDVVGTGGDASGSFNISTCAALIVAGAGVPVAKHGNRALSSRSGAADVLGALGVNIELTPEGVSRCIKQAGIGFMFAPAHHPAMKNVGPTRVELGTRTVFNLLGPLSNPAGVKRQMVGVFSRQWIEPLVHVLKNLGAQSVWVVH